MPWPVMLNCPCRFGAYEQGQRLHEWSQEKRTRWKQRILQSSEYNAAYLLGASEALEKRRALELVNYSEPQVSPGSCLV